MDPLDPFSEIPTLGPQQALLRSGAELGRYSLVRELGRGGMGVVWLARDRELGGRPVALKFLPEVLVADSVAVAALRREAETMLALTHPGIVRLLTLDSCKGLVFLVMEYLAGPTLRQVLGEKKQEEADNGLTPAEALWVLEQVAPALDHAHGENVLHRDLKPGNLLLDRAPKHPLGSGRERLKMADFGIAYVASTSFTQLTGRPHTSGTLPYMAPEVLLGGAPSRAGDLYALGATLFELVAGVPPFHHGDISRQITDVPAPPLRSGDDALDAAVAVALSKDPEARPDSAGELLALADFIPDCAPGSHAELAPSEEMSDTAMDEEEIPIEERLADNVILAQTLGLSTPLHRTHPLMRGETVADWQWTLRRLGWPVLVDGVFGPLTDRATRDFQAFSGCTVDGKVGLQTWIQAGDMPDHCPSPSSPPFPGRVLTFARPLMKGSDVKTWQARMRQRGWHLKVDGVFGPGSRKACLHFQHEKGIPSTGQVDDLTWKATWDAPVTHRK